MKPLETVGRVRTADDQDLVLYRRDGEYQLRVDGLELMSSRASGSETALAELALEALGPRPAPKVLVGGLGFGYTLRATLDRLPKSGTVVVAEVFRSLVEWNHGPLAGLADRPLEDPRARVEVVDVYDLLGRADSSYDAILLDVDNGPEAFTLESNQRLYGRRGLKRAGAALAAGGVVAFWSGFRAPHFVRRLERSGFVVETHSPRAHHTTGHRHHVFLARPRSRTSVSGARMSTAATTS